MFHGNGHGEWFYSDRKSWTGTQAFRAAWKSSTLLKTIETKSKLSSTWRSQEKSFPENELQNMMQGTDSVLLKGKLV